MKKTLFLNFLKDIFIIFTIMILSIGFIVWVIKAVGYLDIVAEDGHGFEVYFKYAALNFPRIVTRILPFIFIVSLFYKIVEYEKRNELLIFWINGITKEKFINIIIIYSFIIVLLQIFLNAYVNPVSHDKARSFIRKSSTDFFPSLIKEGKFIDAISGLTIFIESKDADGNFSNIFLSNNFHFESESTDKSEIIFAKKGILVNNDDDEKYLQLSNGKILNNENKKIQEFNFSNLKYDLSKLVSSTTKYPKIQEYNSFFLLKCVYHILSANLEEVQDRTFGIYHAQLHEIKCENKNFKFLVEEFLKRFYKPLYIPLLGLICSLLVFRSRNETHYEKFKNLLFFLAFIIILISEISVKFSSLNLLVMTLYVTFPIIIFILIYVALKSRKFS